MHAPSDDRVRAFLTLTLQQWKIEAAVEPADVPVVARIRLPADGGSILLERAARDEPFRWYLRQERALSSSARPTGALRRPCGSFVGVLAGLRRMLNVDAGGTARVFEK